VRAVLAALLSLVAGCDACRDPDAAGTARTDDPAPTSHGEETPPAAPREVGTWRATATDGAPAGRDQFADAWTGSVWLVWGGHSVEGQFQTYHNTGAIYDPAQDAWRAMSTAGAPSARMAHEACWTGTQLLVWGGRDGMNPLASGGLYSMSHDAWSPMPNESGLAAVGDHSITWTGERALFWGGARQREEPRFRAAPAEPRTEFGNAGAFYDLGSGGFAQTSAGNAPSARAGHVALFAEGRLTVWGGLGELGVYGSGGVYDVESDAWREVSRDGAPSPRFRHTGVLAGREMIVWGGDQGGGSGTDSGAIYDPDGRVWRPTSRRGAPAARAGHVAVWTGERMVVWGGYDERGAVLATGGVYDPVTDTWAPTATLGAPDARRDAAAAWTGDEMLVWGGRGTGERDYPSTGGLFRP
jgi:N-acetylneuraminic acid mutarotase